MRSSIMSVDTESSFDFDLEEDAGGGRESEVDHFVEMEFEDILRPGAGEDGSEGDKHSDDGAFKEEGDSTRTRQDSLDLLESCDSHHIASIDSDNDDSNTNLLPPSSPSSSPSPARRMRTFKVGTDTAERLIWGQGRKNSGDMRRMLGARGFQRWTVMHFLRVVWVSCDAKMGVKSFLLAFTIFGELTGGFLFLFAVFLLLGSVFGISSWFWDLIVFRVY